MNETGANIDKLTKNVIAILIQGICKTIKGIKCNITIIWYQVITGIFTFFLSVRKSFLITHYNVFELLPANFIC